MPSAWSAGLFLYTSPGPAWEAVRCMLPLDSESWKQLDECPLHLKKLLPTLHHETLQQLSQASSVQCYFMYLSYVCEDYSRAGGHSEENSEKYETGIFNSYHLWSPWSISVTDPGLVSTHVCSVHCGHQAGSWCQVCREAPDRLRCSQASCKKSHSLSWFMEDNPGLGEVKGLSFSSGFSLPVARANTVFFHV